MNSPEDCRLSADELQELQWAHRHLEHPSFAARLSSVIGVPIERTLMLLPRTWYRAIQVGATRSIEQASRIAIKTLRPRNGSRGDQGKHLGLAALAGMLGGFAGPPGLLLELPAMTILLLRSIAGIAEAHGEDLATADGRMACVEVFGLGARSRDDDAAETGYYGLRTTLAFHFGGSLGSSGISPKNLPGGMDFLRGIASRFGVAVSDDIAARLLPAVGAVSGALLNLIFMQHFQDVAKGHFIVRRLERKYGPEIIHETYDQISRQAQHANREFSPLEGW